MNGELMSQETHGTPTEGSVPEDASESEGVRMVLWTRRPVCGPRTEVIDRLSSLEADGTIADFSVETWPDEVAISEHTEHARVVEQYKEFELWAEDNGVTVSPPFEHRTISPLVGKTREVLTVPMLCLAVYDSELRGVYPCSADGRTCSVSDYLDAYEALGGPPADGDTPVLPADG
jgi:hypothetical protein